MNKSYVDETAKIVNQLKRIQNKVSNEMKLTRKKHNKIKNKIK